MSLFLSNYELANLRKFSTHKPVLCLHCGYQGPAGVVQVPYPTTAGNATMLVLGLIAFPIGFLLGFLGILVAIVLWVLITGVEQEMVTPYVLECPRCLTHLNIEKEAYENG